MAGLWRTLLLPCWLLLAAGLDGGEESPQCPVSKGGRSRLGLTLLALRSTLRCGDCPGPCSRSPCSNSTLAVPGPGERGQGAVGSPADAVLVGDKRLGVQGAASIPPLAAVAGPGVVRARLHRDGDPPKAANPVANGTSLAAEDDSLDIMDFNSAGQCSWGMPSRAVTPFLFVATCAGLWLALQLRSAMTATSLLSLEAYRVLENAREAALASEVAKTIGCYFALLDSIIFTMVIPDSYDIILALGGNAILSGAMIGAHKFGTALGAVGMYSAFRIWPNLWRTRARASLVVCALCNLVGTATYLFVAAYVDHNDLNPNSMLSKGLLIAIFAGRITGGCGSGMRLMTTRTHIARLTPREQRPDQQSRFLFAITLGVGVGPVVAAAVKSVDVCRDRQLHFMPTGVAGFTLSLCQLAAALQVRSLDVVPDLLRDEEASVSSLDEHDLDQRRCLVICGLAFSVVRGLCLSGVEAASAMLLEVRFGWHPWIIGLTIGLAFLTCIPIRMIYIRLRKQLTVAGWVQVLMTVSLVGSLLLFRLPKEVVSPFGFGKNTERVFSAGILLLGDGLLFPCFFLSDGLVQGLILQHPLPAETSILNLSGVNLMNTVLLDGFARVVGPALSRYHVSSSGQSTYALQQLTLTMGATVLVVLGFLPQLQRLEAKAQSKVASSSNTPVPGG